MGTSKKMGQNLDEVELVPDAWPRFEKFIRKIAKAGPQHRVSTSKPKAKATPNAPAPSAPKHRASRKKIASLRPPGSPTYSKPVIVFGVVNEGGVWRLFEPYRLLPDGNIEFTKLASAG